MTAALQVANASKTFGENTVLSDVNLEISTGEIRALVGQNGSGKSTLIKILAGYHLPDPGTDIIVAGRHIQPHHPGQSESAGLRFVHQDLGLVGDLNAVENLGLGLGYGTHPGRPLNWRRLSREASATMAELGYEFDVTIPVDRLGASERTAIAVARAVTDRETPTRLLVLDEPTANLPGAEVERLFALLRRVRDRGIAILYVSHHLNEVFDLTDSVSVLRSGILVSTTSVGDVTESSLVELMLGRAVEHGRADGTERDGPIVLSAHGIGSSALLNFDLDVRAGEIVGVAGITGSGRETIAPLLFGTGARTGTLSVDGSVIKPGRPDHSIAAGLALVPAERARNAVLTGHDVAENLSIARGRDFMVHGVFRRGLELKTVSSWLEKLDVRPRLPRTPLSQLSGGNAQKVILARWLRLQPKALLLDEPTQGVDVGAKEAIHLQIQAAADGGAAVVVCSTDNEELARLCSRVLVLHRGKVVNELRHPFHADDITAASLTNPTGTNS